MFIFVMHLYLDTFLCLTLGGRGGGEEHKKPPSSFNYYKRVT